MIPARWERPYVDRPVADADRADLLARSSAAHWGLAEPTLLRSSMNRVYVAGEVIVRIGHVNGRGESQLDLAARLAALEIAVPQPAREETLADGDLVVTAWRRATGAGSVDWESVGRAVARLHRVSPAEVVPSDHPIADPRRFPWWNFESLLEECAGEIDARALSSIERVLDGHSGWDDWRDEDLVLCHGDVHPGNVVVDLSGPLLVDWDLMCLAPREWDLAPLSVWSRNWGGDAAWFDSFERGYDSEVDLRRLRALGDLRDLAATLMAVRAGRGDAERAAEGRRRLAFWRDGTGPPWTSA